MKSKTVSIAPTAAPETVPAETASPMVTFSREGGVITIKVPEAAAQVPGRPIQLSIARRGPAVVCGECGGTGTFTLTCQYCKGKGCEKCSRLEDGYDLAGRALHPPCEGKGCTTCHNKGYFNSPCRVCQGRGERRPMEVMRDITIPLDLPQQPSRPTATRVVVHRSAQSQGPAAAPVKDNLDPETLKTLEAIAASK